MKKIINQISDNRFFYLYLLIILCAIIFSIHVLSNDLYKFTFGETKNPYLSENSELLRQFLLLHMIWAFIKLFVVWMFSFSLLFLIKNRKDIK